MSDDSTKLRIGELVDPAAHTRTGQAVLLDPASLTTHGVIVGMTGSGKTGLGVVLLEEALQQGIPAIIIDPKGDLGNLLLTFPDLSPAEFAPWVETPAGTTPGTDPATGPAAVEAQRWRDGLASWGLGPADVAALRSRAAFTIYTPGSTAGVPLNLIGSLDPPPGAVDDETRTDQIETIVSGLLQLVGIDSDPLSGREHILLANLLANAWQTATPIDLGGLIAQVQQPPMRRLGVIELDTFFPPADRNKLALAINGLLASPSFSSWSMGEALDPARLLTAPDGRPRAAIISIGHLDDAERQFVVSLLLSRVIAWMRQQPGTASLRALVYFDEVFGFVPPNGMPPAKKPILTLLKQARAFGIGMVLATQNPVDLDYKAIGNAGTWLIGRLQTEQDRGRLIDGLSSAGGTTDPRAVDDLVAGLAKREFVLRQTGTADLPLFTSRWSLSYLRGPVTREQIAALNASAGVAAPPASPAPSAAPPPPAAAVTVPPLPPVPPPPVAPAPVAPGPVAPAPALAADETPIPPTMAPDVRVAYLDAAAPWATALVAVPNGQRLAPALVASVHLHFDERALGLDLDQTWEAVLFPLAQHVDVALAIAVDHDERDFRAEPPAGGRYVIPGAPLDKASFFKTVKADLVAELQRTRTVQVLRNKELALSSRPGETAEQFAQRCREVADQHENDDAAKLRTTLERKIDRIKTAIDTAQDRVDAAQQKRDASRTDELLGGAGSLVSGFLGGRRSARGIANDVRGVASRHNRTKQAAGRIEDSQARLEDKVDDLHELEQELADALVELDEHWAAVAAAIETVDVPLDKGDVRVDQLFVAWVPVGP